MHFRNHNDFPFSTFLLRVTNSVSKHKKELKQLYTILFILAFSGIQAQNNYFEEWYSAEKEDIPQNSIKSIAPDKHGFLWMSTENGLLRFDGRKFKVYNSSNTNLKSNRFAYISGNIENDSLTVHTAHHLDSFIINQRTIKKNNKAEKNIIDQANTKNNFEEVLI